MSQEIELVRIPVDPTKADALVAAIKSARAGYLAPPACTSIEILRTPASDEVSVLVTWSSAEAHAEAQKGPHAGPFFGAVSAFAAGPPSLSAFTSAGGAGALEGQVALVTGGAGGIGRAVVQRYVREGCKVGVADVNKAALASLKDELGAEIVTIEADLSSVAGNEKAVQETVRAFGKLDVFVGNAGIFDGFSEFADLSAANLAEGFELVFGVNVRGLILGARTALPELLKTRGSIVVTLSNSSLYPDGGGVMYVASKHAALGVVRQLAHELAPAIRVNGVAPGATRTGIHTPAVFGVKPPDVTEEQMDRIIEGLTPLAVHATPADHAGAYVLLASRTEGRVITGAVIETDAGLGIRGLRRTRGGDRLL